MHIYIASSWKNQHAVQMLTAELRKMEIGVYSFVENNHGEHKGHVALDENGKEIPFEQWIHTERADKSFKYDTDGATLADLVIYIGPSGCDAWAEVGAAWASKVPILGLYAKGEQVGLMRKMIGFWYDNYQELLDAVREANAKSELISKSLY